MRRLLPVILAAAAFSVPASAGDEDKHDPKKIFTARCASCHTVPDPGVRSDKIWLTQIRETT